MAESFKSFVKRVRRGDFGNAKITTKKAGNKTQTVTKVRKSKSGRVSSSTKTEKLNYVVGSSKDPQQVAKAKEIVAKQKIADAQREKQIAQQKKPANFSQASSEQISQSLKGQPVASSVSGGFLVQNTRPLASSIDGGTLVAVSETESITPNEPKKITGRVDPIAPPKRTGRPSDILAQADEEISIVREQHARTGANANTLRALGAVNIITQIGDIGVDTADSIFNPFGRVTGNVREDPQVEFNTIDQSLKKARAGDPVAEGETAFIALSFITESALSGATILDDAVKLSRLQKGSVKQSTKGPRDIQGGQRQTTRSQIKDEYQVVEAFVEDKTTVRQLETQPIKNTVLGVTEEFVGVKKTTTKTKQRLTGSAKLKKDQSPQQLSLGGGGTITQESQGVIVRKTQLIEGDVTPSQFFKETGFKPGKFRLDDTQQVAVPGSKSIKDDFTTFSIDELTPTSQPRRGIYTETEGLVSFSSRGPSGRIFTDADITIFNKGFSRIKGETRTLANKRIQKSTFGSEVENIEAPFDQLLTVDVPAGRVETRVASGLAIPETLLTESFSAGPRLGVRSKVTSKQRIIRSDSQATQKTTKITNAFDDFNIDPTRAPILDINEFEIYSGTTLVRKAKGIVRDKPLPSRKNPLPTQKNTQFTDTADFQTGGGGNFQQQFQSIKVIDDINVGPLINQQGLDDFARLQRVDLTPSLATKFKARTATRVGRSTGGAVSSVVSQVQGRRSASQQAIAPVLLNDQALTPIIDRGFINEQQRVPIIESGRDTGFTPIQKTNQDSTQSFITGFPGFFGGGPAAPIPDIPVGPIPSIIPPFVPTVRMGGGSDSRKPKKKKTNIKKAPTRSILQSVVGVDTDNVIKQSSQTSELTGLTLRGF